MREFSQKEYYDLLFSLCCVGVICFQMHFRPI